MTAVVQGGPIQQNYFGCNTSKRSLVSMKKNDLLSLFFFDPLHPNFDTFTTTKQELEMEKLNTIDIDSEYTFSIENISEDIFTDPTDLSSTESMDSDINDTSSNTTDCEPLWCGCTSTCLCEEEWWASYSSEEPPRWEEDEREMLTSREILSFEYADMWEEMQKKKMQRGIHIRAKRAEKKDKVWAKTFIKSIIKKKQEAKEAVISEHFQQQKNGSGAPRTYTPFGTARSYRSASDESAEVQRAIALSLSTPASSSSSSSSSSSRNSNVLACGLTQHQLNELMNRELTPEDYELLLRLDEGVKKKTVERSALDSFASRAVTAQDVEESACTICLSEYAVGETLTILPCGHFFHENCVREWLSKSSVNCPIDGLPVHSH